MRSEFEVVDNAGKTIKLTTKALGYAQFEEADKVYAIKMGTLIRDEPKILLRQNLDQHLRGAGIWTEEDDEKLSQLNKDVDRLLDKVRKGGQKLSEGRRLCIEVMDKRKEMVKIGEKRRAFENITAEYLAEAEKMDYIIYISTVYADSGKNYWESLDDLREDKRTVAYEQAYLSALQKFFGVDGEFEKRLPENKWLKKYGFVDDNLNYVDRKTGDKVDRDGNSIKSIEEQIVKEAENLIGEIQEEAPFIDDETNEPVKEETVEEKPEVVPTASE